MISYPKLTGAIIDGFLNLNPVREFDSKSLLLKQLLSFYGVKVNDSEISQRLLRHPYQASLLSISEVLSSLSVVNICYRTDLDALTSSFSTPLFCVLFLEDEHVFAIVESCNPTSVSVITENSRRKDFKREEFAGAWNNIVLEITDVKEGWGHEQSTYHNSNRPATAAGFLLGGIIAFFIFKGLSHSSNVELITCVIFSVACFISWLLVLQEIDNHNPLVKKLCSSSASDCDEVSKAPVSRMLSWISTSEIGFVIYAGALLSTITYGLSPFLSLFILVSPFVSLFFVWQMAFVIRKWCQLCLIIHLCVLTLTIVLLLNITSISSGDLSYQIGTVALFLMPGLLWIILRPLLKKIKKGDFANRELYKLRSNPVLFNAILKSSPKQSIPNELKAFTFGDQSSTNELIIVLSTFCNYCGEAFNIVERWIKAGDLDFRIVFIFISDSAPENENTQFVKWLSSASSEQHLLDVLHSWYNSKSKHLQTWALESKLIQQDIPYRYEILRSWMNEIDISGTPTFYLNGYKIPDDLKLEDLRWLISEA